MYSFCCMRYSVIIDYVLIALSAVFAIIYQLWCLCLSFCVRTYYFFIMFLMYYVFLSDVFVIISVVSSAFFCISYSSFSFLFIFCMYYFRISYYMLLFLVLVSEFLISSFLLIMSCCCSLCLSCAYFILYVYVRVIVMWSAF